MNSETFEEESKKANELRKNGKYLEALTIYETVWEIDKNAFVGAGYLHCLRKLKHLKKALDLAIELENLHKDHYWASKEIIWIFIAELNQCKNLDQAKEILNHLIEFNLEDLASNIINRKMVQLAIEAKDWSEAIIWLDKIKPESLKDLSFGKSEWTEKILWYYNKIKCLFELKKYEKCISYCDDEKIGFIKNERIKLFILRYKAKSLSKIERFDESIQIYEDLCKIKPDWWLLHEFAIVLLKMGRKEEALNKMYHAASSFRQLDKMVKLLNDIGELCLELGKEEEALNHLKLSKLVREDKGWNIELKLESNIKNLEKKVFGSVTTTNIRETLSRCKKFWKEAGFSEDLSEIKKGKSKKIFKKNLRGKVILNEDNKPFCFINTGKDSIFCYKSDLPKNIKKNDIVVFDIIPSFDKKKKRESTRAVNIEKVLL
ncbi:MAG: tetratricopeptide repeat protein [Promethearchaeota archaeon]